MLRKRLLFFLPTLLLLAAPLRADESASFTITEDTQLAGKTLEEGKYRFEADEQYLKVTEMDDGEVVMEVPAHWVPADEPREKNTMVTSKGEIVEIWFDDEERYLSFRPDATESTPSTK